MDDKALERVRRLGKKVDDFLRTEGGKYLLGCCDSEDRRGVELLRVVDAHDPKAVLDAQTHCRIGSLVKQWLTEVVVQGINAEQVLTDRLEG